MKIVNFFKILWDTILDVCKDLAIPAFGFMMLLACGVVLYSCFIFAVKVAIEITKLIF